MPPELSDQHVAAICRVLIDHGVQFVIIGGVAARLHDTGHATVDVDICPSTDDVNLTRLAAALSDLGARLRVSGDPDGVPFEPHAEMLRQVELMTLITEHGPLDLCFVPDGFPGGYVSLSEHASVVEIASVDVPVASWRMSSHPSGRRADRRTSLRSHLSKLAFDAREGRASPRRARGKSARGPLRTRNDR